MEKCVLCEEPLSNGQPTNTLSIKGCEGIAKANELRKSNISTVPGQVVHVACRKEFCSPTSISSARKRECEAADYSEIKCARRSTSSEFKYSKNCLFCGNIDKYYGKEKAHKLIPVRTMDFQTHVMRSCNERKDSWAEIVKCRIEYAQDLHAADAVYHISCSSNFRTGKQTPQQFSTEETKHKRAKHGRPPPSDLVRTAAFLQVAEYLEINDDEQTTINDLIDKMQEFLANTDCEPYGFTYMKEQLQRHFSDKITITDIKGRSNVVTFRDTAFAIIQDFYYHPKNTNCDAEKMRLIETAAKLIKSDVKSLIQSKDIYPSSDEMTSATESMSFLPGSLQLLLQTLAIGKNVDKKVASLGQAIMQCIRPRVLVAPLQIGLGIQMHHQFASKFLIDTLHEHGFCSSYKEVKKFERSAAVDQGTNIPVVNGGQFIQYVADNVDHNIRTLDGLNTFHGMGIIATVTPSAKSISKVRRISVTAEDITAVGRINIRHLASACSGLDSLRYELIEDKKEHESSTYIDRLWKISLTLRSPRPAWAGMMQTVHKGTHPGLSSVHFLPMIDLNPTDMTCIYSTLLFVCEHARRYNVTPIITFDQPLWWKAMTIIESEPEDSTVREIVLRLGGFHTLMSFLGAIGYIMAGSGLRRVLELVYADNTVTHMLAGKAYDRAVRGHLLVDAALNTMLFTKLFGTLIPIDSQFRESGDDQVSDNLDGEADMVHIDDLEMTDRDAGETIGQSLDNTEIESTVAPRVDLNRLAIEYDALISGEVNTESAFLVDVLQTIDCEMQKEKDSMKNLRTAKLWLQYMDMVDIMRRFIKSERTGDWILHMQVLHDMLPYLAAAGHNLYTKSIHVYLQRLAQLPVQHPEVHRHFENGLHVVRRSNRYWAGLSTDLVIEQVLMRSMKTTGGLTRGRGMEESQRLTWLLSRPICAEVNNALQEYTSVHYDTSDQHKDLSKARQERDTRDTNKLLTFLTSKSPFDPDSSLHSIDTGITAGESVNVDDVVGVGQKILDGMLGHKVLDYVFKKKAQTVTLQAKSSVNIGSETVFIDPLLLFQRLVAAGTCCGDLQDVFTYELCSYPPALFETTNVLLSANKPSLADALWTQIPHQLSSTFNHPNDVQYVLDGGALLHRVSWKSGETYDSICSRYIRYVGDKYGSAMIVFDGYESGPSTKDCTHGKRAMSSISLPVHFTGDMVCSMKKDAFLTNKANKQRFINLLSNQFEQHGNEVLHAKADADVLMVQTTIAFAEIKNTVLVGDDTDLLVLLCSQTLNTTCDVFFRPEPKLNSKRLPRCWNVKLVQGVLGSNVCDNLLFAHAILGCDTTSRVFGIGKPVSLKKLNSSAFFRQQAAVFNNKHSTRDDVVTAGEHALVCLYNGQTGEKLDTLRLQRFREKVASSAICVQPRILPPTSSSAQYHSQRTYLQVQQWCGVDMCAVDWGWKISDEKMVPLQTNLKPAPENLLQAIKCNCKSDCSTLRCSCRKHGLECSPACGECKGLLCSNVTHPDTDSDVEDM